MKSKDRSRHFQRRWLTGGVAGLVAAVAGLVLLRSGFGDGLTRVSYDFPFFVRHVKLWRRTLPTDEVRMAYLDELTFKELNQPMTGFINRSFYAQLIDRLSADGAKLIVFDVLFNGPSADAAADQKMAEAIRRSGRVVLAGNFHEKESEAAPSYEEPLYDQFVSGAAGWGNCNFLRDADGGVRHFFPNVEDVGGTNVAWLPWKVAQLAGGKGLPDFLMSRWFNFPGPPGTLQGMSISRVLLGDAAPGFFRDKIVFVGQHMTASAAGTEKDDFRTPYSNWGTEAEPGTDFHAIATLNFLHHDWLDRLPFSVEALLAVLMAAAAGLGLVRLQPAWATGAGLGGMLAVALGAHLLVWSAHIWFSWLIVLVEIGLALFISILVNSFQLYIEKRLLQESLAAHLSPAVARRMVEDPALRRTGGVKQEVSIVFTDIANFSRVSEMMDPDDLVNLLNRYFDSALRCIHENDGTIVDLIGDAIFAIWNAPVKQEDHRERACRSALKLHRQLIEFEAQHRNLLLKTRVGLHTGTVCVGNIGSAVRFDYTAIGEAVNLASRLEGLNKYLGTHILATREIQRSVEGEMTTRLVGHFKFKGFGRAVEIHELIGPREEGEGTRVWREQFADALQQFRQRNLDAAAAGFRAVNKLRRGGEAEEARKTTMIEADGPSQFYLKKIEEFRQKPPPADWVGEIDLTDK